MARAWTEEVLLNQTERESTRLMRIDRLDHLFQSTPLRSANRDHSSRKRG